MSSGNAVSRRRIVLAAGAALAATNLPFGPRRAQAQGLSERPVRIILAQTPGTTPDVLARTLAPRLQARWNQPFVVENRVGASGAIGMDAVAKAPPDGHTIRINTSNEMSIGLFYKVPFDVLTDFTPITLLGNTIFALVCHPSVPANNVREFIAWAKSRGQEVNYGSPGNNTFHHVAMEQLKLQTGLRMTHIPYKGSAPAFTDLLGGRIAAMFMPMGVALNMARDGKVRLLGGSTRERSPLTPEIASLHELGVTDFNADVWFGVWGPRGLPADIVGKYNAELRAVLAEPQVREVLGKQGVSIRTSTPEELGRMAKAEYDALSKLVREANIKGD
jgi:tripartite-type tricarboxylate transporter receptor subunit TctC